MDKEMSATEAYAVGSDEKESVLSRHSNAHDVLDAVISALENRLQPITNTQPANEAQNANSVAPTAINRSTNIIEAQTERLKRLLDGLEI